MPDGSWADPYCKRKIIAPENVIDIIGHLPKITELIDVNDEKQQSCCIM